MFNLNHDDLVSFIEGVMMSHGGSDDDGGDGDGSSGTEDAGPRDVSPVVRMFCSVLIREAPVERASGRAHHW